MSDLDYPRDLRYTPELLFVEDDSIDKGAHILEVLRDIDRKEGAE